MKEHMRLGDSWRKLASNDLAVLVLWATAGVLLHTVTNGQYGFHRDELATLDDARSLEWGYVAYPPLTPFLARVAFILFGPPETVIVVGMSRDFAESAFESCQIAGHVSNQFEIGNSTIRNPDIFVCHRLRQPWPQFWQGFQYYG